MSPVDSNQSSTILERLHALESELTLVAAGTGLPVDAQLTELVSQILKSKYAASDLQILISSSRKITTTKQFYETETPGMIGLDKENLRELQKNLMEKISTLPSFETAEKNGTNTNNDGAKFASGNSTLANGQNENQKAAFQRKETSEEGFANDDGTQVVAKKMVHVVTTSQSSVSGAGEFGDESNLSTEPKSINDFVVQSQHFKQPHSTNIIQAGIISQNQHLTTPIHEHIVQIHKC